MRGRVTAVVLLVPLLVACGGRVAHDAGGEPVVEASGSEADALTDPAAGSGAPGASAPVRPGASVAPGSGARHNNGVVKLALSAQCVAPGSLLVVTITAPAKAGLGMVIGYADQQAHGAMLTGETDAAGRYTWRVPVDPAAPEGQARVLVSSTGPNLSHEGGGTADEVFRVAREGCPDPMHADGDEPGTS